MTMCVDANPKILLMMIVVEVMEPGQKFVDEAHRASQIILRGERFGKAPNF
jgi:hypothetical protein